MKEVRDIDLTIRPDLDEVDHWRVIYDDTAWLGDQYRNLVCWSDQYGYRIEATGIGGFCIDRQGCSVQLFEAESSVSPELVVEFVFGPVVTVALALQDVWCLHASAIMRDGRAIAFVGDSGAGKSTLARFLNEQDGAGFYRIADDILPVELNQQRVVGLPHFPQHKLPPHQQVGSDCPKRVPVEAVYVLDSQNPSSPVTVRPLTKSAATLALLGHTVAARLFDAELLRNHLSFCAEVAARVPVYRLVYRHTSDALTSVQRLLKPNCSP